MDDDYLLHRLIDNKIIICGDMNTNLIIYLKMKFYCLFI